MCLMRHAWLFLLLFISLFFWAARKELATDQAV